MNAIELDHRNGETLCMDAVYKEMGALNIAFDTLSEVRRLLLVGSKLRTHRL